MIEYSEGAIWDLLIYRPKIRYDGVVYDRAISFKMCIGRRHRQVRSLELLERRKRTDGGYYETTVWAPIEECEVIT